MPSPRVELTEDILTVRFCFRFGLPVCLLLGGLPGFAPADPNTTRTGPQAAAQQPAAGLDTLEERFQAALARRDVPAAKTLDMEMDRLCASSRPARPRPDGDFPSVRRPGDVLAGAPDRGKDVALDTSLVTAFDVTSDGEGGIWAAIAHPGGTIRLLRSPDSGRRWDYVLDIEPRAPASQLELFRADGESSFMFLFFLEGTNSGDLWLARIRADTSDPEVIPVDVGPDTVDDFSAVCDRDSHYYLYCLSANEHRVGRTGAFIRSVDFGRTWGSRMDWWNGWDPHLSYTSGSTLHCVWRYALTGAQIHYAFNRHYGAAGYWGPLRVVSTGTDKCWDPVVAQAETLPEWQAPVWVFYTVGRRDTSHRDVMYAYSLNDGWDWSAGHSFSDPYVDEWSCDLQVDPSGSDGFVGLCYNYGGVGPGESTSVYLRLSNAGDSTYWTRPVEMNAARASVTSKATGPRLVYLRTGSRRTPGVVYSRYSMNGPQGVYFSASWLTRAVPEAAAAGDAVLQCCPNPVRSRVVTRFTVAQAGSHELAVFDVTGKMAGRLFSGSLGTGRHTFAWDSRRVPPGTYFVELAGHGTLVHTRLTVVH
jgi:hypothetical protein